MPGDILIVDTVSTNRIMLKVKLLAAQHRVRPCESCADAWEEISVAQPDLVMIDIASDQEEALALCRKIKASSKTTALPIIATGGFLDPGDRVRALRAGADDVIGRPYSDTILQARIRSLLRARDAAQELHLRDGTRQALGFAESSARFAPPARVAFLTPEDTTLSDIGTALGTLPNSSLSTVQLGASGHVPDELSADLIVLDAGSCEGAENRFYQVLSELRSRKQTRHAAILIMMPKTTSEAAAMALDLGANDVTSTAAVPEEIQIRARNLLEEKRNADRLRETVQNGLEAAVTDPLTGLFNRRYALPHLERMAGHAADSGRRYAVMVIDIDHFKDLNDRYGHSVGDEVLRQVADRLRTNLRAVDLLARIGGEEFLVAVPDSDAIHARIAAERLCALMSEAPFFVGSDRIELTVTVSIGVGLSELGAASDSRSTNALIDAADAALYAAKGAGRNTVSLSAA